MAKYTYDFKHKIGGEREKEKERERERERERDRKWEREREQIWKPRQAVHFTFSRGVFRTLSNM